MVLTPKFRIMCEDLGGTFDMDFNDVVYDVEYTDDHICTITMQAAGGTMPIRLQYGDNVLKKGDTYEIHELFGAQVKQPINVHATNGVDGRTPITFKIALNGNNQLPAGGVDLDLRNTDFESFNLSHINVYVQSDDMAEWVSTHNIDGEAPYKFVVPITADKTPRWMIELTNIKKGYEGFSAWVADPTHEFWIRNDAAGMKINDEYLY